MDKEPLVTVIIPCYNCDLFLEKALNSIINQSYKNLEILVTDDKSTDNTLGKLQEFAVKDDRIRVIQNKENFKIVKTLNNMILEAKGKYIARMDADDISLPERIEKQVLFLENNLDYGICGTNAFHINEYDEVIGQSRLPYTNDDIKKTAYFMSPFYHPTVLIRSDIYKNNLYDEKFVYAEDYELWVRLLSYNIKAYNLSERLFLYRIHGNQTSQLKKDIQMNISKSIFIKYDSLPSNIENDFLNFFWDSKNYKIQNKKQLELFVKDIIPKNNTSQILFSKIFFRNKTVESSLKTPCFWTIKMLVSIFIFKIKVKFIKCY